MTIDFLYIANHPWVFRVSPGQVFSSGCIINSHYHEFNSKHFSVVNQHILPIENAGDFIIVENN